MTVIAKGMIVELLSGGPKMSVISVGDYSGMGAGPKPTRHLLCAAQPAISNAGQ